MDWHHCLTGLYPPGFSLVRTTVDRIEVYFGLIMSRSRSPVVHVSVYSFSNALEHALTTCVIQRGLLLPFWGLILLQPVGHPG